MPSCFGENVLCVLQGRFHPGWVGRGEVTPGQLKSYAYLCLLNKGDAFNCVRLTIPALQSSMESSPQAFCFPLGKEKSRWYPGTFLTLFMESFLHQGSFRDYPGESPFLLHLFCVACMCFLSLFCFLMSLGICDSIWLINRAQ